MAQTTHKITPRDDPKDRLEVEIGDSKQPDFKPQMKIMRWDNEVNASFRLIHNEANPTIVTEGNKIKWIGERVEAHFYDVEDKDESSVLYQNLRYLEVNDLSAIRHSALWELPYRVTPELPTLMVAKVKDQIFNIVSLTPLSEVHNVDKIPSEKARLFNPVKIEAGGTASAGLLLENSTIFFMLVLPAKDSDSAFFVRQSISEACQELGIETKFSENNNDVYFRLGDKWKKFSGQVSQNWGEWIISVTTLGFDFDVDAARDIYKLESKKFTKKGEVSDIGDIVGGLREVLPDINPDELKQLVVEKIAEKLSLAIQPDTLTSKEQITLDNSEIILSDENWIVNGVRGDFNDLIPALKTNEEGASEFEIILKEKPKSNGFRFTLNTKGLEFRYQPELTQTEIDKGHRRPVNVVGSYAVYASEKKINWKGGIEYKCGKVGHIYRPQVEDSAGNKVWEELNIDTETGILIITIPQDFLDNAVYPIRSKGLTFGYTSNGGTSTAYIAQQGNDNAGRLGAVFTGVAGTLDSLHAYLGMETGGATTLDLSMHLNTESTGDDSHPQIAEKENLNSSIETAGTNAWHTFICNSEVISAIAYIISVVGDGADISEKGAYVTGRYDGGGGSTNKYYEFGMAAYTTLRDEDPWTETEAADTNQYSLYATYTPAGAPEVAPKRRRHMFHR